MVKIMIADDSDAIRLVLKDILSIGEHEITSEATDGAEAVDFYRNNVPEILDYLVRCQVCFPVDKPGEYSALMLGHSADPFPVFRY